MASVLMTASVNGIPLQRAGEVLTDEQLRQRACTELLRQAAICADLLDAGDMPFDDGTTSEAAAMAIEALLDRAVEVAEPSAEACHRHYAAHEATYAIGEQLLLRHILFAVTQGVDVDALRKRAESCLLDVRCYDSDATANNATDKFASAAREFSNCPSGAEGGELGWLTAAECAPEFARELFGNKEVGVLPRLIHSRFGFHVVEIRQRRPGSIQPFDSVRGAVAMALRQQAFVTALRQYLSLLASAAEIEGLDFEVTDTAEDSAPRHEQESMQLQ